MQQNTTLPSKAADSDFLGRFREVISDPLNLLIDRMPMAGVVRDGEVYLHNGNRVPLTGQGAYYGPFSQLLVINRGVHEPLEEFVFQELLKSMPDSPLMIELGAYWAHYSMWLKKARTKANVIMVEPDPANLAAGRNNFERNGFDGEFIQAAVGKDRWQLDSFLQGRCIEHVNILYVDIQGLEVQMIAGAKNALATQLVDYIFVSTHSQELHRRTVMEIERLGYRIEVASDYDNESTSFDGLVFASSSQSKQMFHNFLPAGRTKIVASHPDDLIQTILNCRKSVVRDKISDRGDDTNAPIFDQNIAIGAHNEPTLEVSLRDGLTIAAPATLSAITTYVLLEQEQWFEKEIDFLRCFLRPGMNAVDIGANLGLYSLPMAGLVAPGGRIFAYEPGTEARQLLERSRTLNGVDNLEIVGAAVSDGEREGHLAFAASSELRALATADDGEPVHITSLDVESGARAWPSIDFVKIDAEGEEERIIAGGRTFFAEHSPLTMFEIKAGDKVNERLLELFPTLGYRVFRLLPGAPILVPQDASQPIDGYELNLFAAKPDRVSALSRQRLLTETIPQWTPGASDRRRAVAFWRRQKFASPATVSRSNGISPVSNYQDSLAAYAVWRSPDRSVATRCAALAFALQNLRFLCARACTAERASTWARVAWEWGARSECVAVLRQLLPMLQRTPFPLSEPFWPASPRFDDVAPGGRPADWFAVAAAEQFERTFSFSSAFGGASPALPWLCRQNLASAEMERRRTLLAARAGQRPVVPERLRVIAPDNCNAEIWRAGLVPGTTLGA
ncbi:MAG: FkbM family methyltransferase [Roseiarcus sp.]|jgi:FkbM family methyltransferase